HGEPYDRVRASAIVADGLGRERADLVVLSAREESRGEGRGDHLAWRDAPEARAGVGLAVELEQPVDPSVGEVGGGLPPPPKRAPIGGLVERAGGLGPGLGPREGGIAGRGGNEAS